MNTRIVIGFFLTAIIAACAGSGEDVGDSEGAVSGGSGASVTEICAALKTLSTCERNPKCDWVKDPKCADPAGCSLVCLPTKK